MSKHIPTSISGITPAEFSPGAPPEPFFGLLILHCALLSMGYPASALFVKNGPLGADFDIPGAAVIVKEDGREFVAVAMSERQLDDQTFISLWGPATAWLRGLSDVEALRLRSEGLRGGADRALVRGLVEKGLWPRQAGGGVS